MITKNSNFYKFDKLEALVSVSTFFKDNVLFAMKVDHRYRHQLIAKVAKILL